MSPIEACRKELIAPAGGDNAGLLLDFWLAKTGDEGEAKRALIARARAAARSSAKIYRAAFDRWALDVGPDAQKLVEVPKGGRLIVGLGGGSVLETGITLHQTYGVPLIPGSGLKGLASAYCDKEWGTRDAVYGKKSESGVHRTLFGKDDDSGCIVFHDGWILPESLESDEGGLMMDVMTPHHTRYYMTGGQANPPADTDDPVPVTFVSVAGKFRLAVSCTAGTKEEKQQWATLAMDLLVQAVADWGAGGKTSSGYGRMKQ